MVRDLGAVAMKCTKSPPPSKASLQGLFGTLLNVRQKLMENKRCCLLFLTRLLTESYYVLAIEVTMFYPTPDIKRVLNFSDKHEVEGEGRRGGKEFALSKKRKKERK